MRNYGALTIGPIVGTISKVSTPGALWCASGIFSDLARDLCERILGEIPGAKIVSPAYEKGFVCTDGIGRWHDRIFFCCSLEEEEIYEKLKKISSDAKRKLGENISKATESENVESVCKYIENYIQINWLAASSDIAEKDGGNCILNLSKYLDSVELTANFSANETFSPLTKLFNGKKDAGNYFVKNCWLIPENKNIQLMDKNKKIRDISSVANPEEKNDGKKIRSYFAVVQSDGDGMGKCLESCKTSEDVSAFSDVCIKYTEEAAKMIGAYGGLTIYAGGDDLLFLAPLEGKNGENILALCENITKAFNAAFKKFSEEKKCLAPTLSFGVSVNYKSAPLYEAIGEVIPLLMCDAKSGKKNQIAISMHKNSGQSIKLVIPNSWEDNSPSAELKKLLNQNLKDGEEKDEILKSVIYIVDAFKSSYEFCRENNVDTQDFFDNTFDNIGQKGKRNYINSIKSIGDIIHENGCCKAYSTEVKSYSYKETEVLISMLRFAKLFSEKGDG